MSDLSTYIDDLNDRYLELHRRKEEAFWETHMGIADRHEELANSDLALREFLADPAELARLRAWKDEAAATPEQRVVLDGWILMFSRNQIEDPAAGELQREITERETALGKARGEMKLGRYDADGTFVCESSVMLSNNMRANPDEAVRRASFEGLRSIETLALDEGFPDIVRMRNRFARLLGFEDYYAYKVQWAEGFDKKTLFGYLDDLEARTRGRAAEEIENLRAREGESALEPWNFVYHTQGGSLQQERDPYFRFEDAVERWARSFAALGITFRNARVTLDLVDRKGKYENGFMHGPVPAFRRRGKWLPAHINFTANALPGESGSGVRAAETLFHEGGHAAHFANITMDAPCFSQEFAPTSAAFAETQSMFCDSFLSDADWQIRYARDADGNSVPFDLIERQIRASHPFAAQNVRNMLVVCYAEKALYEMSDDELTPENILAAFREVETRLTSLPLGCPRPTLAVPHLLAWDASAYYHGYVLAEMAVRQTRAYFRHKYGYLLDNPSVGKELAESYWAPGNSRTFLEFVRELTGGEFSADALVSEVTRSTDDAVRKAREAVDGLSRIPEYEGEVDLDLRLSVIHGSETVVDEGRDALAAAAEFRTWLMRKRPTEPQDAMP